MAFEHWFRWHHGCVTDPKWRVIASRASQCVTTVTVGHVVTVWAAMMENASMSPNRGVLSGWDDEDVAALFGYTTEQVSAIREAMQGKTLDGDVLTSWGKRQPNREDSSAKRTQTYRERKRDEKEAEKRSVTQCDAGEHAVTLDKTRVEKKEEQKEPEKTATPPDKPAVPGGTDDQPKRKAVGVTIDTWLSTINEGEDAVPEGDKVFRYADATGIPREFLHLAWLRFIEDMRDRKIRKRDWVAHFRNAVKGNWFKLWWFAPEGDCRLTTVGEQARRAAA